MHRGNPVVKVAVFDPRKSGSGKHRRQFILRRKAANLFDQIAVGIRIARDQLSKAWQ